MSFASRLSTTLFLFIVVIALLPVETYAFGAGNIPDFSYLHDKAFRHGDIESILETLIKSAGGAASGSFLRIAHSMISNGAKFNKSDVKKVYFGNWLRDYSQAMDISGLSKLTADSIILIVSVLGFMTFGFATEEFQVTADRLGVYLPVEHIDNPKGYAAAEGDARRINPKLRPPVDDRELEIDERTGMKNYMASEGRGWDTSTAFIRRTFRACIEAGRRAGGREGADLWEAYRLLGTGMHTMEDLLAHSNWCEIALRKMGHSEVFCHVGDNVIINTPNGSAPPLVTGSFGGADFIHSLMGEATDHLSQASVTDLTQKMNDVSQGDNNTNVIKDILSKLPIGGSDNKMSEGEQIQAQSKAYNFDPNNIAPPEVQQQLLALLKWRDGVYRDVVKTMEMIPGLDDLIDQLSNALNAYVYTVISPYIAPILQQATGILGEGSKAVINTDDQYEVFNNPQASDPTHSFLAKDHFALILNEPAGKVAQIVVENTVNLLIPVWSDNSDPDPVIDQVLEAFHHPYYATGRSRIQQLMFQHMEKWLGGLGPEETQTIIQALTKDSVRNGNNKRPGSENETQPTYGGHSHGPISSGYSKQQGQAQYDGGGQYGGSRTEESSFGQTEYSSGQGRYDYEETRSQVEYGGRPTEDNSYGNKAYGEISQHSTVRYGQEDSSYSRPHDVFSQRNTYKESQPEGQRGSRRSDNDSYGRGEYGRSERKQGYQGKIDGVYGQSDSYGEKHTHSSHESRREGAYPSSGYGRTEESSYESSNLGGDEYGSSRYGEGRRSEKHGGGYESKKKEEQHSYGSTVHGKNEYGSSGFGGGEERSEGYGGGDHEGRRKEEHSYGSNLRDEYSSSGYGQGGRSNEYGGEQYESRKKEERSYESSIHGGNEHGSSRYGGGEEQSERYGGGLRTEERSYGSNLGGDEYGSSGYGRGGRSDEYGEGRRSAVEERSFGNQYGSSGYGGRQEGYGGGEYGGLQGYTPSDGGGETFGVEKLNVSDGDRDYDDGEERHRGHHGRRHQKHDDYD